MLKERIMEKIVFRLFIGSLVFLVFSGLCLMAQNAVVNPKFETMNLLNWEGDDPSLAAMYAPQGAGMSGYCCRNLPGPPLNNGPMT